MKKIRNNKDYQEAIKLLEEIGDNKNLENDPGKIIELEELEKIISEYEDVNYTIKPGDPIEIIKLKMNYLDLKQKDLIPIIGSRGVVSEVINKKRALSKTMIRKLSEFLEINQEILNVQYDLVKKKKVKEKKHVKRRFDLGASIEDVCKFSKMVENRGLLFNYYAY